MSVKILRDGTSVNFTSGDGIDDVDSLGSASIVYITGGTDTLPSVGDKLTNLTLGSTIVYNEIKVTSIEQSAYGFDHIGSENEYKYNVSYESEEPNGLNNAYGDFKANLSVVSMEDPTEWRYADAITTGGTPLPSGTLVGAVKQRLSKVVTTGSFTIMKHVEPDFLPGFNSAYLDISGKLNTESLLILGDSGSNSISFQQGQVICGALDGGEKNKFGLYEFKITFQYKLIAGKTGILHENITESDWQYVLAPKVEGAGWLVPVRTDGTDGQTPTEDPFIYSYANDGYYTTFLETDYSEPI